MSLMKAHLTLQPRLNQTPDLDIPRFLRESIRPSAPFDGLTSTFPGILAMNYAPEAARAILEHLGLSPRAPRMTAARRPHEDSWPEPFPLLAPSTWNYRYLDSPTRQS